MWTTYDLSCNLVSVLLHGEVGAPVLHKHVRLHKGLGVQQQLHSLPRRQLALRGHSTGHKELRQNYLHK